MKKVFSSINFRLLFAGNLVSEIGNSLFGIAMSFYVLDLTNDNGLAMGLFLFVTTFTRVIVSPLAGVLVEKWNRVRVIYMTDFIRAVIFTILGYIVLGDPSVGEALTALYTVSVLSSINAGFFGPAMAKVLPEIVGDDQIQAANGAQSIVGAVQNIIGVLAGAALYAFVGVFWVVVLNAVSFFLSGVSEMFIRTPYKHEPTEEELAAQGTKSHMDDFKESVHYIKKRTGLFTMIRYSLILNFAFTPLFAIAAPFLFKSDLVRVNAEMEYAYTSVAFSVAMLIAGITVGSMKFNSVYNTIRKSLMFLSGSFAFMALMMALVSNGLITYWVFYVLFILGLMSLATFMMFTNVPLNAILVRSIDPNFRGRVFSTVGALTQAAVPFSMLIGGALLGYGGVTAVGIFSVVTLLYPTLGYMFNQKVKTLVTSIEEESNKRLEQMKQQEQELAFNE